MEAPCKPKVFPVQELGLSRIAKTSILFVKHATSAITRERFQASPRVPVTEYESIPPTMFTKTEVQALPIILANKKKAERNDKGVNRKFIWCLCTKTNWVCEE